MLHRMGLQDKWFDAIANGSKCIELRLFDEKRQKIKIGDTIEFTNKKGDTIQLKVRGLLRYDNFASLLSDFPTSMVAWFGMDVQEMLDIMEQFYPKEMQKKFGVIGIRLDK